eukprot:1175719-Prorocentrum_minimum.AAC.2
MPLVLYKTPTTMWCLVETKRKTDHTKSAGSMLVVSEFVGCTPSLSGALRINPWNVEDTADHLYRAITISQQERVVRRYNALDNIASFYGSSCANNGKGALDTPDVITRLTFFINPRNVEDAADHLYRAITVSQQERVVRRYNTLDVLQGL